MGELLSEFGDLVFTLVIGYMSAIEFLYVVRHLYHYSCNHDASEGIDSSENLSQLQDSMQQQLANAANKEVVAGTHVMKDGVPYKEGFRLEAQQAVIDQLKQQLTGNELSHLRRKELEEELAKQSKIAEQLRKELKEAEVKYERQLERAEEQYELQERAKNEAELKAHQLTEEEIQRKRREEERFQMESMLDEQQRKEAEENARILVEAERQRVEEQRKYEKEEEDRIKRETEYKQREELQRKEAEEQSRKLAETERQREEEQRKQEIEEEERLKREAEYKQREELQRKEADEQSRKLAEAERKRESEERKCYGEERIKKATEEKEHEEQHHRETEEEADKLEEKQKDYEQLLLTDQEQEVAHRSEAEKNSLGLLQFEKDTEQKQAAEEAEAELATKNFLEIEHRLEEQLRAAERDAELTEKERQLIASIKERDIHKEDYNEHKETELLRKILEAREQLGEESEEEQSLRLIQRERDQEDKQKRIEENAFLFMKAEKEMAELQSKLLDDVEKRVYSGSLDSAPQTPVVEPPCIKRNISPLTGGESSHSTVKTQLAQDLDEVYSVRTKPLLFPEVSDDASSIDPASSKHSSFSTQPSEETTTDSQYLRQERQDPDGDEDHNLASIQYSDDYLRSLDGIKQRPLQREDGSGRRRAFKKRRSSNSSNSSRDSRHSRDEELKMFTSLEEEEMKDTANSEFTPIRYTTEPTLKVKGHHRRHKRSPAKDMRHGDDSLRSSLERLSEETSDPWGEVKPENYKQSEFWKREKTLSIEEETEFEKPSSSGKGTYDTANNMPNTSSFEEATQKQNQEALLALQKLSTKRNAYEDKPGDEHTTEEEFARSDNTNSKISFTAQKEAMLLRSSVSPRLRRSPAIEEIDEYEGTLKETTNVTDTQDTPTPTINVHSPLDFGPWRDEHGMMLEGLSDFYDFTVSVNPSRSRNVSPAITGPNTPQPKNVSFQLELSNEKVERRAAVEVYDDTEHLENDEFKKENIIKFLGSLYRSEGKDVENKAGIEKHIKYLADDPSNTSFERATLVPLVNIIDNINDTAPINLEESDAVMNSLAINLRSQQINRSHSRSKSPLPTPNNLKRSVENRRFKMIKHNEDILEKLIESKLLPELNPSEEEDSKASDKKNSLTDSNIVQDNENNSLIQTSHIEKRESRSKSPMRLPTSENLSKGLEKRRSKLIERNDELIKQLEERSLTPESPKIVVESVCEIEFSAGISADSPLSEEEDYSKENMDFLVQSLRIARSKTKSKSPRRIESSNATSETKSFDGFQYTEYEKITQDLKTMTVPPISIIFSEPESELISQSQKVEDDCSREQMNVLIHSLRVARSRSTSRNPMTGESESSETNNVRDMRFESKHSRYSRSKSPSRSHSQSPGATASYRCNTPSRSLSPHTDEYHELHVTLNVVASKTRTPSVSSQEQGVIQSTNIQKQLDEEALEKLRNASEEIELRTLSPLIVSNDEFNEQISQDNLAGLPLTERAKFLRKSTTPDYNRTISEEMSDVERIRQAILERGFKRSTYVGESMDFGCEFEQLRKEAAKFQRSRSPSPSVSAIENISAQKRAEDNRKIQDLILQELASSDIVPTNNKEYKSTGAIPKAERFREEPSTGITQRSTYKEYTDDTIENLQELRLRNAQFRKSASISCSPLRDSQLEELKIIDVAEAKRVFKGEVVEEVSFNCRNFNDFSSRLNADFFDTDRRASDSALIQMSETLVQQKEDLDMEPEEYHHYRRFSLAQEQPVEQYPGDDYIFIQEVEIRTRSGFRAVLSENVEEYLSRRESVEGVEVDENDYQEEVHPAGDEEEYSNASDESRQTVVEVDDEIDEDISDFNERGPAEESHHETSECEEAEREMDRYAGREASDWNRENIIYNEYHPNEMITAEDDEGAVGGLSNSPYDSDSFAIDQIYDEAIKNRKQSGILREYDSILLQMSMNSDTEEQYALCPKISEKITLKELEFNPRNLNNECKEPEMHYLWDSNIMARQSTRLRSRYGYNPIFDCKYLEDDLQVDMNYKPKKEYKWRRNFKLDEDIVKQDKEITLDEIYKQEERNDNDDEKGCNEMTDNAQKEQILMNLRKFSLGGGSVTLFSRSPEKSTNIVEQLCEVNVNLNTDIFKNEKPEKEKVEKSKRKKTKKKSHKESKASLEESMNREDEEAYDNQVYSRRSSSLQIDTDSPKRKSRSRRSSKSSLTNEDYISISSPRVNVAYNEAIMEEFAEITQETVRPKKMKKRKKVKESMANENKEQLAFHMEGLIDVPAVSTTVTPGSANGNILSTLSPQNSVCVTPASTDTETTPSVGELPENLREATNRSPSGNLSPTSSITSTLVDTFDILRDASFYPLF